jgi:hypothetical protein
LPLLGPAISVIGLSEFGLVQPHHGLETVLEQLLSVPEVTDDFLRAPVPRIRTARKRGVVSALDRRREIVGRALQPFESLLTRLLAQLFQG